MIVVLGYPLGASGLLCEVVVMAASRLLHEVHVVSKRDDEIGIAAWAGGRAHSTALQLALLTRRHCAWQQRRMRQSAQGSVAVESRIAIDDSDAMVM